MAGPPGLHTQMLAARKHTQKEGHGRTRGLVEPGVFPPLRVLRDPAGRGQPSFCFKEAACLCGSPHQEPWVSRAAR